MTALKISRADARVTVTPNAAMTTLASPTQGASSRVCLWRVEMAAEARGPRHTIDAEQAWHLLEGSATFTVGGQDVEMAAGDTMVIPEAIERQIATGAGAHFVVSCPAGALATPMGDGSAEPVAPAWMV